MLHSRALHVSCVANGESYFLLFPGDVSTAVSMQRVSCFWKVNLLAPSVCISQLLSAGHDTTRTMCLFLNYIVNAFLHTIHLRMRCVCVSTTAMCMCLNYFVNTVNIPNMLMHHAFVVCVITFQLDMLRTDRSKRIVAWMPTVPRRCQGRCELPHLTCAIVLHVPLVM